MTPYFIAAVILGAFSRYLGYCPICKHYRITRSKQGKELRTCEACGSELESVKRI